MESALRAARSLPATFLSIPPRPLRRGPAWGLGRASGKGPGSRPRGPAGSRFVPKCANVARAARRACEEMVRVWGREDGLQGSKVARPQGPASPAQPVPGVWSFAKPGGGRAGTVGGAAVTHAQSESVPSARRRRGGSAEAQLADKRGRQHLELPGESFQQAGKDRYFEWQATPFLIASVYVVQRALRRA